ncbi:MarR family transcriptional regulator [Desulfopila sp. IMCC35006]|uniref:MarR family transcriptional regulator n=1 Tax=Desulfopila sp. IMCC35006 TaxID=2569542 RepID=UPI0010AD2971|nr:helix-turn-helix domain-containing protein [Desulfopila sp. IMCC35006]TKB23503.1 MarR family transcriptional regulator [Desulfopila sp. IMCC35006]
MTKITKKEISETLVQNEKKWTKELMAAGWTVIPSIILEKQSALGLTPTDVNVLLQLAKHWWYQDQPPRPSKKAIADCMGVSPSTVQRSIARLAEASFIIRKERFNSAGGQTANSYHFDGLIEAAKPFAVEHVEEMEEHKKRVAETRRRKRPAKKK